jgi:hypothetical protein
MQAEQVLKQRQWVDLQKLAQQQTKNMPVAHYSGIQKPFDTDAMPGAKPISTAATPGPTTVPALSPAPVAPAPAPAPAPKKAGGVDFAPTPANSR